MEEYKKVLKKKKKLKISGAAWDEEFELLDVSCSILRIQNYFKYIIKKTSTDKPPIQIYVNRIQNKVTFKIRTGYYLELLTPETMKLLESTKRRISKDKNGENIARLENIQVVLVHCNIVFNQYQYDSRVLSTFVPNNLFCQLRIVSPTSHIYSKTFYSVFIH